MENNKVCLKGPIMRVPKLHPHYSALKFTLTMFSSDGSIHKLFEIDRDSEDLIIRRGLLPLLVRSNAISEDSIIDESASDLSNVVGESIDFDNTLLSGITLRPEQELAIRRSLRNKRGLIQAATGAGKTYMICGIIQYLKNKLGYYPDTLIIVPTQYLMESFRDSLSSVGIPSRIYNDCRGELSGITVAHPMSINNDIDKGILDFSNLKVLIGDEAHHASCSTWTKVFDSAINAEIVLGFSASIVDSRRLPITKINQLDYDEALVYSSTGDILLDIPTSYYSDGLVLAKCCVARIGNNISEKVSDNKNWHQIRSIQLESDHRSCLTVKCASELLNNGLKSLILINTQKHGFRLLEMFNSIGLSDVVACSYGNSKFYKIEKDEIIQLPSDSMDKFKTGDFKILIGTSHIYEGVDIPNLDAVIMAVVGKKNRRIIQGVGRSLRRTKNGKYAYIVDFVDSGSGVLSYHSISRRKIYHDLIGVSDDMIFDSISVPEFSNLLKNIECNNIDIV